MDIEGSSSSASSSGKDDTPSSSASHEPQPEVVSERSLSSLETLVDLSISDLRRELSSLGLYGKGTREELEVRLLKARERPPAPPKGKEKEKAKAKSAPGEGQKPQPFEFYLVFDVEATCVEERGTDFMNEIIEFPVVLVRSSTLEIVRSLPFIASPALEPSLKFFFFSFLVWPWLDC